MRRNFAQVLKAANINPENEYQKLYDMLYGPSIQMPTGNRISAYDELRDHFIGFYFRGTCLSIEEFNDKHGFHFQKSPDPFVLDELISLCEYIWNMLMGYQSAIGAQGYGYGIMANTPINIQFYLLQISTLMENMGYERLEQDGFTIFTEKSPAAIAVAESSLIPQGLSYKLISYNHHSMKGNMQEKKNAILQLADLLEPKRKELNRIDSTLSGDLFYLFNNLNLRHNNIDSAVKGKYKQVVAEMEQEQLEKWYDETYQMCLLAFMSLEQAERKIKFDELKLKIEAK